MKQTWLFLFVIILLTLVNGCREDITGELNANMPPETDLFIQSLPGDSLNQTSSVQTISWDGRDPDGFVTGFFFSWIENPAPEDWEWTTERSLQFPLQITGQDTAYTFQIKAVDNKGSEDPSPARQVFPIKNTAPQISWTPVSRIPDTTFTVASFIWSASDLDGDETISHFEYALDDTTEWRKISGYRRDVTLTADSGIVEGAHVFYLRAVDIAGSASPVIRMPEQDSWYAKTPKGRFLIIDDFENEAQSGRPDHYYKTMVAELLTELGENGSFDYWNIEEQFPASRLQFSETMKLFDRIIWYTDLIQESDEHFIAAQIAIPEFLANGGKIVYTVQFNQGFGSQGSPLEFSPVDSLGKKYNYITSNSIYYPEPVETSQFYEKFGVSLPELKVSKIILGLAALRVKTASIPLYRYDESGTDDDPLFIVLGVNDNKLVTDPENAYDFVFSGTPLHYLNGNNTLDEFFKIIFRDVF